LRRRTVPPLGTGREVVCPPIALPPGVALAVIALGYPVASSLLLPNGCRAYLEFGTAALLPAFWNTAGGWQSNLAIPLQPALNGLLLAAQCFCLESNAPGGYEGSNGVLLGLGS
jgi:hypothetical protein